MLRASVFALWLCTFSWSPHASRQAVLPTNTSHVEKHHEDSNQSSRLLQTNGDITINTGGSLQQIICVVNLGRIPKPAGTISYEVGVVRSGEESNSQETMSMHQATVSLAGTYGFSAISSIQMSASYTFQGQETTTTSMMTSSTLSERLTLNIPEVGSQSTWCAYRLEWRASEDTEMKFMFTDIIVADERLEMTGTEVTVRGALQTWNDRRGYLFWTRRWRNGDNGWFTYMQNHHHANVRGWRSDPGPQGHWLFTERDDGSYLLAPKRWRSWYMYMENHHHANVRGWGGDPGPAGHFILTRHNVKSCFLISTKKWPSWYIYMQDTEDGNIRGHEGDPGDQGCWQMQPAHR